MKKFLVFLVIFIFCTSISYAIIEKQRVNGRLQFNQKLDPIQIYVAKNEPCRLKFGYNIRSYFFTEPKEFKIKAGFDQLFTSDAIVITANSVKAKTYLFVELETLRVKKRPCLFIEIIEDIDKAEDDYYFHPSVDLHYIDENGIKIYHSIDTPRND